MSPLLYLIFLLELVLGDTGTYRDLPICADPGISSGLRVPGAAGVYRDIRANMERT